MKSSATKKQDTLDLGDVAETALATLACRAIESASPDPILRDPLAEDLFVRLRPTLAAAGASPLQQALAEGELESGMRLYVALRSRHFDRLGAEFLRRHPEGALVNLGGGLDTRWHRLGRPSGFVTVDVPEIIRLRNRLLGDGGLAADVRGPELPGLLAGRVAGPVMFMAEGLLMYLSEGEVRDLIASLRARFPDAELVAEVFNRFWLDRARRGEIDQRLGVTLKFGETARFVSGFEDSEDPVRWFPGVRVMGEWSFVDEPEAKLGRLRKLRHFPRFRKRQWVAHYRL